MGLHAVRDAVEASGRLHVRRVREVPTIVPLEQIGHLELSGTGIGCPEELLAPLPTLEIRGDCESEHPLAFGRRGQHGERRGNRTLTTRSGHRSSRGLKKGTKRYLILAADRNLRVILRALFRFATARSLQRSMAAFSALFCLRGGP